MQILRAEITAFPQIYGPAARQFTQHSSPQRGSGASQSPEKPSGLSQPLCLCPSTRSRRTRWVIASGSFPFYITSTPKTASAMSLLLRAERRCQTPLQLLRIYCIILGFKFPPVLEPFCLQYSFFVSSSTMSLKGNLHRESAYFPLQGERKDESFIPYLIAQQMHPYPEKRLKYIYTHIF